MGIFEDITRMQGQGKTDADISLLLQQSGYGIKEISDVLSQSKIKQAVSSQESSQAPQYSDGQEMMQSIASAPEPKAAQAEQPPQEQEEQQYQPQVQQQYANPEYSQQYAQAQQPQFQQYESYDNNADTITEIAEQVMSEKLSSIRKQLEIIIDLKNSTDARLFALDERLKRIEKIIDRLQLSLLQKVGEYITNVEDIKNEMVETQKSFKAAQGKGHKTEYKHLE